jgi:hypothetical protein
MKVSRPPKAQIAKSIFICFLFTGQPIGMRGIQAEKAKSFFLFFSSTIAFSCIASTTLRAG